MRIRRATTDDMPGIGRLLHEVNDVHAKARPDLFRLGGRKYTDDELAAILDDPERVTFVAVEDDGRVLGHAFCVDESHEDSVRWQPVRILYIDDICVDEGSRGRRVGTALYEQVLAYAREQGYYEVTLHVWEGNPGAKAFYEHLGMRPFMVGMEQIL